VHGQSGHRQGECEGAAEGAPEGEEAGAEEYEVVLPEAAALGEGGAWAAGERQHQMQTPLQPRTVTP
jgi:hypothetical protein